MNTSPILAAIGFGNDTERIVQASVDLALHLDAPILPIHIVSLAEIGDSPPTALFPVVEHARERTQRLFPPTGSEVPTLHIERAAVELGDAAEVLARLGAHGDARLAVVGGGRRSALGRFVARSVVERLTAEASMPVWVARGVAPAQIERVVVAIDVSEPGVAHVDLAVDAATAFATHLDVVAVIPSAHAPVVGATALDHFRERVEAAAAPGRRAVFARATTPDITVDFRVVGGNSASGILASTSRTDLLVLGPGSHRHVGLGETSVKVLRRATCSVLLVPKKYSSSTDTRPFRPAGGVPWHTSASDNRLGLGDRA